MSEVNVTIFDRNYRLAVTTGEEKMLEDCARQVNEQMLAVRAAGRVIAIDQIAVLTALELAYDARSASMTLRKPRLRLRSGSAANSCGSCTDSGINPK